MKRTGLDSDDDDEADFNPDEEDLFGSNAGSDNEQQQQQDGDKPPAGSGRGRLKLKKRAAAAAESGEGLRAAAAEEDLDDNDGLGFADEVAGDTTAADFVDELFVDDPDAVSETVALIAAARPADVQCFSNLCWQAFSCVCVFMRTLCGIKRGQDVAFSQQRLHMLQRVRQVYTVVQLVH